MDLITKEQMARIRARRQSTAKEARLIKEIVYYHLDGKRVSFPAGTSIVVDETRGIALIHENLEHVVIEQDEYEVLSLFN